MANRLPACLGAVGVLLLTTFASAAPVKVAALLPQLRPNATNELRDRFHDAVSRGLQSAAEITSAVEVRMRLGISADLASCAGSSACVARVAGILRVDGVIATDIVTSGKRYFIRVQLLDAQGREISRAEETCEICTLKEADDAAARASAQLSVAALKATVAAEPEPRRVEPKPEPKPEPKLTVVAPPPAEPRPSLTSTSAAPQPVKPALRYAAIGTAAFGVIGLVVGISLVVIDGRPTCDKPNPMFSCERVYSTVGGGGTMLALGLASLAASGTLFYFDWKQRQRPPVRASFSGAPGAAMLRLEGKF